MLLRLRTEQRADDVALVVDPECQASLRYCQRLKALVRGPHECRQARRSGYVVAAAHHLAAVVEGLRLALAETRQHAEVANRAVDPDDWMELGARQARRSDDLS